MPRTSTKKTSKKKTTTSKPKGQLEFGAKAAFVRERPDMTAAEIVAAAKAAGIDMATNHVYNIRGGDKKKGLEPGEAAVTVRRAGSTAAPVAAPVEEELEIQLKRLVLRMGLDRIDGVLAQYRIPEFERAPQRLAQPVKRRVGAPAATNAAATGASTASSAAPAAG